MKSDFRPGITRVLSITVTEDMCPSFNGVIVHHCYSTWSVAHHFELVARMVLVDYLEPHEEGIGSHLSIDHLAPCRVGSEVQVRAILTEVSKGTHPRVMCDVTAHDGDRLLARGKQVQVVMNRIRLKEMLERS